jgi:hypothetical protein
MNMKKIIIAIPHSHTWMWTQTCLASLLRNPPEATGFETEIVVVDNSPWSPAIRGLTDTSFADRFAADGVLIDWMANYKNNRFHASALDCIVEKRDFDYLMALETDVLALRPTWLQWFVDQLKPTDFAVGHWHHEAFINPSCTLYRGDVLRSMAEWCKTKAPQDELRWGEDFSLTAPLDNNLPLSHNPAEVLAGLKEWIGGPFAEKRGWPEGTTLKESPSGQQKGPGWYEPGQMLHHWAVNEGYTYTVCPTATTQLQRPTGPMPVQTFYGNAPPAFDRQLEYAEMQGIAETVHLWGGTRALDILKHAVTCNFVGTNTPFWLEREARFWRDGVPPEIQKETLELIRKYGWHYKGAGTPEVTDRDREAVKMVEGCYANGGVYIR